MDRRYEGKVVIVTGAAGGIGLAAVERFANEGAQVVAVDLAGSALDEAQARADAAGASVLTVTADVTKSSEVEGYVKAAVERFGGVDVLFNNAGILGWVGPSTDYPEDVFDKVLAVNVKGVWLGIKHAVPEMRKRGGGAIVNTSSVAGLGATATIFAYGASKHAVIGMTKSAAIEFAGDGIRTNAVCPSPFETQMMRSLERGINPDAPEAVRDNMARTNPMGRYGEPAEVAALVAYLCSDEASYVNGAIVTVDGGSRAR
ncbi:MAG: glucose 1-dehydrogenase [Dehalococcoidia bacterium]|nr:glucose 1-dehydrogenase [Dehalococcoidia bacterium]MCA9855490.1 glucose 1-dehydrogenase [Dehalococcoidia bacterium]